MHSLSSVNGTVAAHNVLLLPRILDFCFKRTPDVASQLLCSSHLLLHLDALLHLPLEVSFLSVDGHTLQLILVISFNSELRHSFVFISSELFP